jgi:thioesterase domain-containing protein
LLAIGIPLPTRLRIFLYNNLYERIYPTAARQYKPQAYPGRVILFQGSKAPRARQPNWKKLAVGGIEIYEVPGDHLMILEEPGVRIIAEHLKPCLEKARAPAPSKQTGD